MTVVSTRNSSRRAAKWANPARTAFRFSTGGRSGFDAINGTCGNKKPPTISAMGHFYRLGLSHPVGVGSVELAHVFGDLVRSDQNVPGHHDQHLIDVVCGEGTDIQVADHAPLFRRHAFPGDDA